MKRFLITYYLVFIILIANGQNIQLHQDETFILNNVITGSHIFRARDYIELVDGFNYDAISPDFFLGEINPDLIPEVRYLVEPIPENRQLNVNLAIGSIKAGFNVSPNGAAEYDIPVVLPPGTKGMAPDLSLHYNSSMTSNFGLLGRGWSIKGLSSIERTPKTIVQDGYVAGITMGPDDRFEMDGNRLVVINGSYGANGSIYHTEMESFSKITSFGNQMGPESFMVETKDGRKLYYGLTQNSKVILPGHEGIFKWLISRIEDNQHNYLEFRYKINENEYYIDEIVYSGNSGTNLAPYASVRFLYGKRSDITTHFILGTKVVKELLLTEIKIRVEGTIAHRYKLDYYEFEPQTSPTSNLLQLTESGNDGKEMNSTVFYYNNMYSPFSIQTMPGAVSGAYNQLPSQRTPCGGGTQLFTGDFNGDGWADYLTLNNRCGFFKDNLTFYEGKAIITAQLSTPGSDNPHKTFEYTFPHEGIGFAVHNLKIADFNGDGMDDIVFCWDNVNPRIFALLATGIVSNNELFTLIDLTSSTGIGFIPDLSRIKSGDCTGDNRADIMVCTKLPGTNDYDFHIIEFPNMVTSLTLHVNASDWWDFTCELGDFDGNGKDEIMLVDNDGCRIYDPYAIPGSTPLYQFDGITDHYGLTTGDFNGDGRTDILSVNQNPTPSHKIHYLSGSAFLSNDIILNVSSFPTYWSGLLDKEFVKDFNGDGKCDIIQIRKDAGIVKLYLFFSARFNELTGITETLSTDPEAYEDDLAFYHPGDFNGDGVAEISYNKYELVQWDPTSSTWPFDSYEINYPTKLLNIPISSKKNVIRRILDGNNKELLLSYNSLAFQCVHGQQGNISHLLVNHNKGSGYPVSNFITTNYVLTGVKTPTTANNYLHQSFMYEDALVHKTGRGFLGFLKIHTMLSTGEEITQEKQLLTDIPCMVNTLRTIEKPAGTPVSSETKDYHVWNEYQGIFFIYPVTSAYSDYLKDIEYRTDFSYDLPFGNITSQITTVGPNSSELGTEAVSFDYIAAGSWCPSKISSVTVTKKRGGKPQLTRKVQFDYYTSGENTGLIKTILKNPGLPKQHRTDFLLFDDYGNIEKIDISGSDIESRTETYDYDPKGRFLVMYKNALNQVVENQFEKDYGNIVWSSDANQMVTNFQYDGLGRLTRSLFPDRTSLTIDLGWDNNGSHNGALYHQTVSKTGVSPETTYYDFLNREIQLFRKGFNGEDIVSEKHYNQLGLLQQISEPHFVSSPQVNWTQYYYEDPLFRCTETTSPSTHMQFSYDGRNVTTTNLFTQQYSEATMNAFGEISRISEQDGANIMQYTFNSWGQMVEIDVSGTKTTLEYDPLYGNQTHLADPDAGTYSYMYNSLNHLISQTDPNGLTTTFNYDKLGRVLTTSNVEEGITSYVYDTGPTGVGRISSVSGSNGIQKHFQYDAYGRLWRQSEVIDELTLHTDNHYNPDGFTDKITYPSGFSVNLSYHSGYLHSISRGDNSELVYRNEQMNAMGQVEQFWYGNDVRTTKAYHPGDHVIEEIKSMKAGSMAPVFHYGYEHYADSRFISKRTDHLTNLSESFEYDPVYSRLTKVTGFHGAPGSQITYETGNNGNISGIDGRIYAYGHHNGGPHAVSSITGMVAPEHHIAYTSFNKVKEIIEGDRELTITYGPDYARRKRVTKEKGNTLETKYYSGNYEKVVREGSTEERHYIAGNEGVVAVYVTRGDNTSDLYYLHKDHLGSIMEVTDASGSKVPEGSASFDAWGNRRDPATWRPVDPLAAPLMFDRGFTGHEHYEQFGLIDMNGRCYDPRAGRFLSPDLVVQQPGLSQSYNRYSYCLNNPLNFVDPGGYEYEDWDWDDDDAPQDPPRWYNLPDGIGGYFFFNITFWGRTLPEVEIIDQGRNNPIAPREALLLIEYDVDIHEYTSIGNNERTAGPSTGDEDEGFDPDIDFGYDPGDMEGMDGDGEAAGQGGNDWHASMLPQGDVQQAGIGGEHLIGPALIAAGQPWIPKNSAFAKAIFPPSKVALQASKNTSLASLTFRRISTKLGFSFVGGTAAKFVPVAGWAWTFYDVVDLTVGWDRVMTPASNDQWVPNRAVFPDGTTIYVCFKAGTQILASEGLKPIEQFIVGDSVYSYNLDKNTIELSKVVKSFERKTIEIYELTTTNQKIYVTAEHPFYVKGKGWVKVKDLQVGFELKTNTNTNESIVNIKSHQRPETVYNIEVEGNHNYFVTGSSILVHNK